MEKINLTTTKKKLKKLHTLKAITEQRKKHVYRIHITLNSLLTL